MVFLRNPRITYSSVCILRAIKEQEEDRVMTTSFSDKGRAAALDRAAEISRSENFKLLLFVKAGAEFKDKMALSENP